MCEAIIMGAFQGNLFFADGPCNSMTIRISFLDKLEWKDQKIQQQVKAAVAKNKDFVFQVFDLDTLSPTVIFHQEAKVLHTLQKEI